MTKSSVNNHQSLGSLLCRPEIPVKLIRMKLLSPQPRPHRSLRLLKTPIQGRQYFYKGIAISVPVPLWTCVNGPIWICRPLNGECPMVRTAFGLEDLEWTGMITTIKVASHHHSWLLIAGSAKELFLMLFFHLLFHIHNQGATLSSRPLSYPIPPRLRTPWVPWWPVHHSNPRGRRDSVSVSGNGRPWTTNYPLLVRWKYWMQGICVRLYREAHKNANTVLVIVIGSSAGLVFFACARFLFESWKFSQFLKSSFTLTYIYFTRSNLDWEMSQMNPNVNTIVKIRVCCTEGFD